MIMIAFSMISVFLGLQIYVILVVIVKFIYCHKPINRINHKNHSADKTGEQKIETKEAPTWMTQSGRKSDKVKNPN